MKTRRSRLLFLVFSGVCAFALMASCESAQVTAPVDTKPDQKQLHETAERLERDVKPDSIAEGVAVQRAVADLNRAADQIASLTSKLNDCAGDYENLQRRYEHSQETGGSLWTRIKRTVNEYWTLAVTACAAFFIGTFFGRRILDMLVGALKGALHI